MSILDNLKTDNTIQGETDSVGKNFNPVDSNIYQSMIKLAYYTITTSQAICLNVVFLTKEKREIAQQFYMTSGKDKGCKNYYVDKEGKKQYLPGFNMANALALLTTGKEIGELTTEPKVIKLWDYNQKAEVPTKVEMYMDLLNKPILIGVIKQIVDKKKKDAATNKYIPTGESREENEVDKVFAANDGATVAERKAKQKGAFYLTWLEKWKGKVRDKRDKDYQVSNGLPSTGLSTPNESTPDLLFQ